MEYFEEHYAEDLSLDGAIHLGLDILHSITEGRFDVDTIEVGVIELETRKFRRLDESELGGYLQTIRERHAGEGEEGEEA